MHGVDDGIILVDDLATLGVMDVRPLEAVYYPLAALMCALSPQAFP